ncbi:unnamed protein product [Clavelina lepadiformis]|uniref:Uncharacterized protein n=1 Tax=Clavelina lepadiformis TaxID=159417 RepID=A0ABP0G9T2_CLALP
MEERMRHIYRMARTKAMCKRDIVGSPCMRSQDGQLQIQLADKLRLWKEYCEKLLNEENLWDITLKSKENVGPVKEITVQEVRRAMYKIKIDVAEKRRIWIEALKSQLVRFEKLTIWSDEDDKRRYISLLCELNESSDMELFNKASLHFPTRMSLYGLKLSSSEAAIFCDVLSKQQKELKKLHLSSCFSPGDVERLISAISEMPEKVKELNIMGNIIKDIPGPEFFAKIEERLRMIDCFGDGRFFNFREDSEEEDSEDLEETRIRARNKKFNSSLTSFIARGCEFMLVASISLRAITADVIMELRRGRDSNDRIERSLNPMRHLQTY